jgi:hypothetical protein
MFIKPAGLKRLLFIAHKDRQDKYLNKLSWNKTWDNFYKKARRYTDRQLIRLFGDASPVERLPPDDIPEDDTKYQRLLYGEFIRQNHHRLAFDIADTGLPGDNTDIDVFENCNCGKAVKTMIGLIAQSHGMKLRETEEFLKHYELAPQPDDIPVFYLMAVLRMADYLHIGRERASKLEELTDKTHSPESKRQLHLNQAVISPPSFDDEQKSVNITADPDRSSVYEDVENLLRAVQRELDSCWAILAEKYAYKYELSIHRVRSNLFDEDKIASFNDRFLTRRAALDVNPDIIKHLIGPLYDDNPSYGVRELIQNAVDACGERRAADKNAAGKITIHIDTKKKTFGISDNGIGMSEDVIRNYFLVAGSSYRDSDAWRVKYMTDDGGAKITRTGRFGIGALAGFLIGDEITVTTRHIDDKLGFQFTFSSKPETLDIRRVNIPEPGTSIEIIMYEKSSNYFKYTKKTDMLYQVPFWTGWYYFSEPELRYYLDGTRISANIKAIPEKGVDKDGWYDVKSNIFHNMKFKYTDQIPGQVIVNGIIVADYPYDGIQGIWSYFGKRIEYFPVPAMSIIDRDNKLGVNLNRTKIINFPELALAAGETFKYYLANLLAINENNARNFIICEFIRMPFAVSNRGYTLLAPSFICHTGRRKVIFIFHQYDESDNDNEMLHSLYDRVLSASTPAVIVKYEPDEPPDDVNNNKLFTGFKYWSFRETIGGNSIDNITFFGESFNDELASGELDGFINDNDILGQFGLDEKRPDNGDPPLGLDVSSKLPLIVECVSVTQEENIALELLREYIPFDKNHGWIPFNIDERKKMYPKVFSELERYTGDSDKYFCTR